MTNTTTMMTTMMIMMRRINMDTMKNCKKHLQTIWKPTAVLLLFAFIYSWQIEFAWRDNFANTWTFMREGTYSFLLATLIVFLILLIFKVIIPKMEYAILAGGTLMLLLAFINYYKITIRNEPVFPWDILILREAFAIMPSSGRVAINYSIFAHIGLLLIWFFAVKLIPVFYNRNKEVLPKPARKEYFQIRKLKIKNSLAVRLLARAALVGVLVGTIVLCTIHIFMNDRLIQRLNIFDNQWAQIEATQANGFITTFLINCKYFNVRTPEDYSQSRIMAILDDLYEYKTDVRNNTAEVAGYIYDSTISTSENRNATHTTVSERHPNIILIMNESFTDASLFTEVVTCGPVTPTFEALKQTAVTGKVMTPQFGGGTANSEFEVLTGMTLANLPAGSTPYQQFINRPTFSYPRFLAQNGYFCLAIHPFDRRFWSRDTVYPLLGFHDFLGIEAFEDPEISGQFISDREAMRKIISEFEAKRESGSQAPLFNFTVTMQNHFPYSELDYPEEYRVDILEAPNLSEDSIHRLRGYMTGLRDADQSLADIIAYFEQQDEPTIIIFFGDHLGSWGDIEETYARSGYLTGDLCTPENIQKIHSTPFVIWSNFKDVQADAGSMQMYQLLPFMTDLFNLPRPAFFDYLLRQANVYRGFIRNVFFDHKGRPIEGEPCENILTFFHKHRLLQYDLLHGAEYGKERLQRELFAENKGNRE